MTAPRTRAGKEADSSLLSIVVNGPIILRGEEGRHGMVSGTLPENQKRRRWYVPGNLRLAGKIAKNSENTKTLRTKTVQNRLITALMGRDWRSDDGGNPNNWSKRGNNSDTGYVPASRRRARSRTPSRSRSRSPTGSFYSRRSSRGRTRSPSSSPASKRRKTYENADDEHDSDRPQGWVPHKEDTSHPPLNAIKSIWPPPQDTSSNGSRRSPGRSESPRSLPPSTSITSAPSEADTHNGIDRNGSGSHNGSSRHQVSEPLPAHMSMPPPTIIPAPHAEFVPPPTLTRPLAPARFVTKNAGFRPIGQASSSLKKFFPSDEEDMDLSSDPVMPPAADGGPGSAAAAEPVTPVVVSEDAGRHLPSRQLLKNSIIEVNLYKAQNTVTGKYVALKRIRMESEKEGFPVTAMREIKLLQSLRHENVVRLYEMMVSNGSVYMVFEYMDHDLTGILSQTQFAFTDAHLKSFNHQMLAGLAYLHHKGVIHRDIKGSNILVNNRGELKLGDFGLARFYQKRRRSDYTNRVITLWYRPPELLFGATVYGPEIDMWSAGCIMLELFTKKPVFQGQDEIHQLTTIYKVIGTPTPERWPELAGLPWYELIKPQNEMPNRFRDMFARWMKPAALDLAGRLLCYNPLERATAAQALEASYFVQEEPVAEAPTGLSALKGEWHELDSKRERAKRKRKE
ncbi:unnamed protein product [Mycena citricolor]|uniref:[RNA-polymerase]-subunit kinase n=1 Tax=Mycena citricolor TaxID=2018698 RepID=A0AAD2K2P0_9AGAR|nr:unnamed protein product [Mycena citricolor]